MNGWHRLWVFGALLCGAVLSVIAAREVTAIRPAFSVSTLRYVSDEALLILKGADPYFGIGIPVEKGVWEDQIVDGVAFQIPAKIKEADKKKVSRDLVLAAHREATEQKFDVARRYAVLWILSSLVALIVGHGIAWVVRGFKRENT